MKLACNVCGSAVSNEVPDGTVVRAFVECPECIEREAKDASEMLMLLGLKRQALPGACRERILRRDVIGYPQGYVYRCDAPGAECIAGKWYCEEHAKRHRLCEAHVDESPIGEHSNGAPIFGPGHRCNRSNALLEDGVWLCPEHLEKRRAARAARKDAEEGVGR